MNFNIELTSTPITSHSGLAFVGEKLADPTFERHMATMAPRSTRSDRMADADLAEWLNKAERQASPDGQLLVEPEITIEAYWTCLDWPPHAIQHFYEKRGTSEQFHSELKTDLNLERLPSGKLQGNQHVLDLGMMGYNLLRLLGQQLLGSGLVPGRKSQSKRLRLRTVMQNLIYMAGRWISHARQWTLRIFEGHGWAQAALSLAPD